ncbi:MULTISPECIES: CAP domain-containing protein [unclassified Nocardioides]|uniref:CAP domain-containing protein n=1 Tax=unclassified Nocardioides TaxID=2615069 RepID=UPI00361D0BED
MYPKIRQSVVAVLSVTAVTSALWLAPAQALRPAAGERYADAAFAATNHQRSERDLSTLRARKCLTGFAERWARQMARDRELVHQSLGPIMRQCRLSGAGENIAYGYPTGRQVVNRGWMNSEGHRENILRPSFRLMGIGAHRDRGGTWWVSQVFGRA